MREVLNGTEGFAVSDRVPDWEALIRDSDFHLCPRGNGPTSYRLYESLQAETIPIYIWAEVRSSCRQPCLNRGRQQVTSGRGRADG